MVQYVDGGVLQQKIVVVLRAAQEVSAVHYCVAQLEADPFHKEPLARLKVCRSDNHMPELTWASLYLVLGRSKLRCAPHAISAADAVIRNLCDRLLPQAWRDLD